ncbi:uncharacterized protein LOC128225569 [Mya arenaria]|uniref:uncharacterized protein LOC128225569 n=1 Tax=Mya arenaria TaxID=6604 RepID=UPI0022E167A8|nr:uncharacterized protein LOC128225569 [Mya arenaria]XP_052791399.1 uncharacterized protein LOC128225569 [Mya arenaria]XP_052791400.1 uncharacterized protein LOC128225569 [Mya arenaria]
MGTLYECLREAKLERYYPSFRSHGITKSEALTRLTVNDCPAFGITSAEDKRRLVELISIVKAVHNTERDNYLSGPSAINRSVQNVKNKSARKRNRSPAQTPLQVAGKSFSATNDVRIRDRSHTSASSHQLSAAGASGLHFDSDDESTDSSTAESEEHSDYEPAVKHSVTTSVRELPGKVRKVPVEKVKHGAGYNYGVPGGSSTTARPKSRPGSSRLNVDRIKVCVRKRPLSKREVRSGEEDMVHAGSTTTIVVSEPKQAVDLTAYTLKHEFIFDEVFDEKCSNEDVYIRAARPLISCVFDGGSATCFAYGQTGAGKTHTMIGGRDVPGLYLLAAHDIFSIVESGQYGTGIKVWVSFFEIYCGQLFDLLNKRNRLHAREDGSNHVCIAGLTETEATDEQSLMQVLEYGNSVRSKGTSGVNPDSSRSHAILQMEIRDSTDRRLGRISFIDLAGSERASDSGDPDKQTRMEGAEINQSLLALKECIRSIDQESRHKPFRQSKLTHILKDSFIGNSRTCMIANISPGSTSCEHTLNTLRYADRVKELRRSSQGSQQASSTRGSTNVAMSNILMNIPASAPSIFQPSNILCSSTPMRQSTKQFTNRNSNADLHLDPSETPLRGPGARRKTATVAGRSETRASSSGARASSASAVPSASVSKSSNKAPITRHFAPNLVSKQNMSSNSESDQTDTDSCNVTGPQKPVAQTSAFQQMKNFDVKSFSTKTDNHGKKIITPSRNIPPVIKSSDTDNDFPTTDFNNEEEMNDLNRTDGKSAVAASTPVFPVGVGRKPAPTLGQPSYQGEVQNTPTTQPRMSAVSASVPVLRKKVYNDGSNNTPAGLHDDSGEVTLQEYDANKSRPSYGNQKQNGLQRTDDSIKAKNAASGSKTKDIEKQKSEVTRPQIRIPSSLSDTIEDDLLFDAPSMDQRNWTPRTPSENSGTQPRIPQDPSLQPEIPAVLPAKSTELTTFSQSPRWHLNKNQNPVTPPQPQQGFRPDPVRTIPKTNSERNDGSVRPSSAKDNSSGKTPFHVVPKQKSSYFPNSSNTAVSSGRSEAKQQPCLNIQQAEAGKEPISANWFDTPADFETHLAKFSGQRHFNSSDVSDADSLSQHSDKTPVRSERSNRVTTARDDEYMHLPRNLDKNQSSHSDSGIVSVASDSALHSRATQHRPLTKQEKETTNYQNSDFSQPGYFSDQAGRNVFQSVKSRVVHSPVNTRQTNNSSPVIKDYVSHSPVPGQDSYCRDKRDRTLSDSAIDAAAGNGALTTEKLQAGACFSPIHPQPLTTNKQTKATAVLSKDIVHPTPVSRHSSASDRPGSQKSDSDSSETLDLKSQLISSHEDQLATVTSLCKQEMKLLLGAKAGNKSFGDYMEKVSEVLTEKMAAIQLLQDQIMAYQLSTQDASL